MPIKAEITEVIERSPSIKSLRLKRPKSFEYLAGQYIMVQLEIEGEAVSKAFSLSSSPTEPEYIEFTKKLTGHDFSDALNKLNRGDLLTLDGPFGSFTVRPDVKKIAMLAGGIGVTPFRSMIKYSVDMGFNSDIVLICSNRSEEDIIFREDFEDMMKRNPHFSVVLTCTRPSDQWEGVCGRIDQEMVKREIPDFKDRLFYICGPPGMVAGMKDMLLKMDIPDGRVVSEDFSGY